MQFKDFLSMFLCLGGGLLFIVLGSVISLAFSRRPITAENVLGTAMRGIRWFVVTLLIQIVVQAVFESIFKTSYRRRRW